MNIIKNGTLVLPVDEGGREPLLGMFKVQYNKHKVVFR